MQLFHLLNTIQSTKGHASRGDRCGSVERRSPSEQRVPLYEAGISAYCHRPLRTQNVLAVAASRVGGVDGVDAVVAEAVGEHHVVGLGVGEGADVLGADGVHEELAGDAVPEEPAVDGREDAAARDGVEVGCALVGLVQTSLILFPMVVFF